MPDQHTVTFTIKGTMEIREATFSNKIKYSGPATIKVTGLSDTLRDHLPASKPRRKRVKPNLSLLKECDSCHKKLANEFFSIAEPKVCIDCSH